MPSQTRSVTPPNPWVVGVVSGMASYIDSCAIVSSGTALVIYQMAMGFGDGQYGIASMAITLAIACGALSGMHAMVSSGTSPKMVEKETQVRMIGYGGMLMESFVAVMAMAAAVSLNQGIYFGMNTSTATVDKLAGSAVVQSAGNREDITAEAVQNLGVTDVHGDRIRATWETWDENGNTITVHDGDAYRAVAEDVGETSIVSRTGGAPTLAVGMAHILHQVGGGRTMMGFWYHFAIMFEALFILSAVDAVTRVARFQLSDALGNAFPKFKDPSWHVGAWGTTAVVVASWGALLLMGVTDPRGGIQTLYPLFGIANQLIAAVALLVVTVMVVRKGYTKWVWIPAIPLVFDTAVTFTASWQKIFSTDPLVGYFQQHRNALAKLETLTDPAAIDVQRAIVRNTMIQGTLSIVFLVMVAFVMVCGLIRIIQTIRNRDTTTSEDPYQESNFYAPETMIASSLMKKVSREYEQVGDPALIPHKAHAEKS